MLAELGRNWARYLVGIVLGMAVVLLMHVAYKSTGLHDGFNYVVYDIKYNKDSVKNLVFVPAPVSKERDIEALEGKVNTLNARFNDLYVFAGAVVTLLLAINISIYIKAGNEVDRHMSDNYEKYAEKIKAKVEEVEKIKEDAELLLNEIKGIAASSKL